MDAKAFAQAWQDGWNSHDMDVILSHYSVDVVFRSKKAIPLVGVGEIRGRAALKTYWAAALDRQPDLAFTVLEVFEGHEMIVILYRNQLGVLATETLWFDADGQVCQAAACHRSALIAPPLAPPPLPA